MSHYMPTIIREFIDDVDATIWEGVEKNTLKETFGKEKNRIVSFFFLFINNFTNLIILQNTMMRVTRECRDVPVLQAEFNIPRFIWCITPLWHAVKNDKTNLEEFWNGQETLLRDFDAKNPNMKRAAGT